MHLLFYLTRRNERIYQQADEMWSSLQYSSSYSALILLTMEDKYDSSAWTVFLWMRTWLERDDLYS